MKIISKRKDYYDGVGRGMFDADLVFKRVLKQELIGYDKDKHPFRHVIPGEWFVDDQYLRAKYDSMNSKDSAFMRFMILHFCGVQHPIFYYGTTPKYETADEELCLIQPGVTHHINDCGSFMDLLRWDDSQWFKAPWERQMSRLWRCDENMVASRMKVFFDLAGEPSTLNALYNSPVVVEWKHNRDTIEHRINDNMGIHGFAKIISPQQAWQEIMMWMGTHYQRGEREMAEISDTIRAQQHGFDKMSFRKAPTKKRV